MQDRYPIKKITCVMRKVKRGAHAFAYNNKLCYNALYMR